MIKKIASIFIAILLTFPVSFAWVWETHQNMVEKLYGDMPRELQVKLNISLMKDGAIAPDKVFRDNVLHHYPPSYELALEWLNKEGSWDEVSYNFGVASHYISDSFSAPHYITKEPYELHSEFEKQVKNYNPKVKCQDYELDLKGGLENASLNYKNWGEWLLTKDASIPQRGVDEAMKLTYSIAFDKFNFTCNKKTKVEYIKGYFNSKVIIKFLVFFIGILLLYICYKIIKRFKYKNKPLK